MVVVLIAMTEMVMLLLLTMRMLIADASMMLMRICC